MKEDYQKALKMLSLFFLSNPVPFNGQSYQRQKCGKAGKKSEKSEYFENEKSFLNEIKNFFHSF